MIKIKIIAIVTCIVLLGTIGLNARQKSTTLPPECWDDTTKQSLAYALENEYGWTELNFLDITEERSGDIRICAATIKYSSALTKYGPLGMAASYATSGRKYTAGTEKVYYSVKLVKTQDGETGVQADVMSIDNDYNNDLNRMLEQMNAMN